MGSSVAGSEICIVPPAELEALASVLDESQALRWWEAPAPAAAENGTSSVEEDVEARMFSLHAAAQHPYGRRLGDRLYGGDGTYAAVPAAATPPALLPVMAPPPAPASPTASATGGNAPPLSPPTPAPLPVDFPPPSGGVQPITPPLPPPPATPGTPSNSTVPFTRVAASPWQLNAASVAVLVALLLTASCGAMLLVCRATRQRQLALGQDEQLCHAQMEGLPHVLWRENALVGDDEVEGGKPGGRTQIPVTQTQANAV